MKIIIIIIALLSLGCFVGAGFAAGQVNEQGRRCTEAGGVLVDGGALFASAVCIDEHAVIW